MCEYVHLCPYLGVLSLGMCVCVCVGVGGLVGKFVGVGLVVCEGAYRFEICLNVPASLPILHKNAGEGGGGWR